MIDRPRLYFDNDVAIAVADVLQLQGYDAITTRYLRRQLDGDHQQLLTAAVSGRVLVTHNWKDFRLLHDAWQTWFQSMARQPWPVQLWKLNFTIRLNSYPKHSGILVIPQGLPAHSLAMEIDNLLKSRPPVSNKLYRLSSGLWVVHDLPLG